MTSGSRGIHVVVPITRHHDSNHVRATFWRKEKRGGRVLVDAARNTYAQTAVTPYAVRALPTAPVATPLGWEELEDPRLHPRAHTLATVPRRLEERGDPWAAIAEHARRLPPSPRGEHEPT
jgi:bifunctional non-homologous end joining protein LigD